MLDSISCGDAAKVLKTIPDASVDLICTDPPYGLAVLGLDWDKLVPPVTLWKECLRVLKPGAMAFVMSAPRQELLCRMIENLRAAGFRTDFTSLYWVYSSGFPKAINIAKAVDKKLGYKRRPVATSGRGGVGGGAGSQKFSGQCVDPTPLSREARRLDGAYGGFQPKPAVEVVIVAMKPPVEPTFVEQALANNKAVTWLDDGRIPWDADAGQGQRLDSRGRFPANVLVSDDMLNEGRPEGESFSRYFDLDRWFADRVGDLPDEARRVLPFLIVPKPSPAERDRKAA